MSMYLMLYIYTYLFMFIGARNCPSPESHGIHRISCQTYFCVPKPQTLNCLVSSILGTHTGTILLQTTIYSYRCLQTSSSISCRFDFPLPFPKSVYYPHRNHCYLSSKLYAKNAKPHISPIYACISIFSGSGALGSYIQFHFAIPSYISTYPYVVSPWKGTPKPKTLNRMANMRPHGCSRSSCCQPMACKSTVSCSCAGFPVVANMLWVLGFIRVLIFI